MDDCTVLLQRKEYKLPKAARTSKKGTHPKRKREEINCISGFLDFEKELKWNWTELLQ